MQDKSGIWMACSIIKCSVFKWLSEIRSKVFFLLNILNGAHIPDVVNIILIFCCLKLAINLLPRKYPADFPFITDLSSKVGCRSVELGGLV